MLFCFGSAELCQLLWEGASDAYPDDVLQEGWDAILCIAGSRNLTKLKAIESLDIVDVERPGADRCISINLYETDYRLIAELIPGLVDDVYTFRLLALVERSQ